MTTTTVTNTSSALPSNYENSPNVTGISLQRMMSDASITNDMNTLLSPTLSTPTMAMLTSIANIATSHSTAKRIANVNSPAVPQLTQKNLELLLNSNQNMPFIFNMSALNMNTSASNPNLNNIALYPPLTHSASLESLTMNMNMNMNITSPNFQYPTTNKPMNMNMNLTRGVSEISCNSIGNAMFVPLPTKVSNDMNIMNTVSNLSRNQIPITPENYIIEHQTKNVKSVIAGGIKNDVHFLDLTVGDTNNGSNVAVIAGENVNNLNAMSNEFIPGGMNMNTLNAMNNHQTLYTANMHMNHIQNPAPVINIIGEMNQFNQYSIQPPMNMLTNNMPIPQNIPLSPNAYMPTNVYNNMMMNNMNNNPKSPPHPIYDYNRSGQQTTHRFLPPRMQWVHKNTTPAVNNNTSQTQPKSNMYQIQDTNDVRRRFQHSTQLQTFSNHDISQMDARQIVRCNFPLSQLINAQAIEKLARDQNGSRFIQQQIELATDSEKIGIFEQIKPHTLALCEDVFGNYVIQKYFEFGTNEMRAELVDIISGHILVLSKSMYGCRVIQKAVEFVDRKLQMVIAKELYAHVEGCVMNQNGNHVIQKMIQELDPETTRFIISAFAGKVDQLSCHPYGCRVIQRLLENGCYHQKQPILDELIEHILKLSKDQYGNYVVQHVLDCGDDNARYRIIKEVAYNVLEMSKHKYSSNVVERSIINGNDMEKDILLDAIIGIKDKTEKKRKNNGNGSGNGGSSSSSSSNTLSMDDIANSPLPHMVRDQYGNYVIQTFIGKCNHKQRHRLVTMIDKLVPNLRKLMFGKHIMNKIETFYEQQHFSSGGGGGRQSGGGYHYRQQKNYDEYEQNTQY